MIERRVLRDDALQATFEEVGYVVVPFLSTPQVSMLYDWYEHRAGPHGPNPPGAYDDTFAEFSTIHSHPDFREEAFHQIVETVAADFHRYLDGYRPLVANFVNKPPRTGVVPVHQNWSVVDEEHYRSVSVWIALVDCVVENGTLQMLDHSHEIFRGRRGMWSYHSFASVEEVLVSDYLRTVQVRAGEAIILDDAIVHYSPPNRTDSKRLAIQLVMVPDDAEPVFFQEVGRDGDVLEVQPWRVREEFFWNFWHGDGDERFAEPLARIEVTLPDYDSTTLARFFTPRTGSDTITS